jgi:hypothetical protein
MHPVMAMVAQYHALWALQEAADAASTKPLRKQGGAEIDKQAKAKAPL